MISSNSLYIQTLILPRPINFLGNKKHSLGVKTSVSVKDKFVFVCPNIMVGMQGSAGAGSVLMVALLVTLLNC